jgi:FkbM family methyltransferase
VVATDHHRAPPTPAMMVESAIGQAPRPEPFSPANDYGATVPARSAISMLAEGFRGAVRWPVFSRTSFAMVRELREQGIRPRMVIDVGANRGQFTVAVCELLRPDVVHTFEPLPDAGERLEKACARYPQVTIHHVALGSAEAVTTLHVNAHSQSSSLLPIGERHLSSFPAATALAEIPVRVVRLDQAIPPEAVGPGCLLKIDAQGYESEVIAGASGLLDRIDWLIAELSFRPLYDGERPFLEVINDLEEKGFRFERPVGAFKNPSTGEFLQIDALFSRAPRTKGP